MAGSIAVAALILAGCGSTTSAFNPTPTLSTVTPSHITAGNADFQLNVVALNIGTYSSVYWNGNGLTTTLNTTTAQLQAQVPAALVATPGTAEITVVNPAPGGGTSNGYTFFIDPPNNPVPAITSLSPANATAGSGVLPLAVNGTGFVSGVSAVNWNGQARATTFVSTTQLSISLSANDLATAGTDVVGVSNPSPGGGTSNSAPFYVDPSSGNPTPGITSLSPANTSEGGAAFSLTLTGRGFVSSSQVNWNGSARTTTFSSSTQVSAAILATDIASAGVFNITVTNPTPGGGTSLASQFTVNNPSPTISSLSPTSATAGGAAFSLTVNGSNFVSNSTVDWNS